MLLVGLTGSIASGKSTFSNFLRRYQISVIDCDAIAHNITQKGSWGYRRVLHAFRDRTSTILTPDGMNLNREAIAAIVFQDPSARRRLNQATHLPILLEIVKQIVRNWLSLNSVTVIDMPLLFETGFFRITKPHNVLVWCSPATQLARLQARDGLATKDAEAIIAAQMPVERKKALADVVIENEGSLAALEKQAKGVAEQWCRRAKDSFFHRYVASPMGVALGGLMVVTVVMSLW